MSALPRTAPRLRSGLRSARMTKGELQQKEEKLDEIFNAKRPLGKAPPRPHREKFLSVERSREIEAHDREKLKLTRERQIRKSADSHIRTINEIERELMEAKSTAALMREVKASSDEVDDEEDRIGSREQRLSRAARFGNRGPPNRALMHMPEGFNRHAKKLFDAEVKDALRTAFRRKTNAEPIRGIPSSRLAVLHLVTASSSRFGAMRVALNHIRNRLGPDPEQDMRNETFSDQWTPTRVVEYNCGTGEGMWAVAQVFGEEAERAGRVLTYEGFDTRVPLLRVAVDMLDAARVEAEGHTEDAELDPSQMTSKSLASMDVSLRTASKSANLAAVPLRGVVDDTLPVEPTEGNGTLVLCNHVLMNLDGDKQRSDFVKSLWERHPSAEVIALVEEGSERGFACIASAREDLLGLGVRSEAAFGKGAFAGTLGDASQRDEKVAAIAKDWPECHVVAPCPHDRPCPLLHDYTLIGAKERPHGDSSPDASSLFQGARIGHALCTTPYTMAIPSYASTFRPQQLHNRKEEGGKMSYVIVRRGPRPGLTEKSDRLTESRAEAATLRAEIRLRAARTKEGNIEELRRGEPIHPSGKTAGTTIPLAEEIGKDDQDNAMAAAVMTATSGNDAEAREQLLRMLPDLLKQQSQEEGDGTDEEAQEAMLMAQRIMEQSVELADSQSVAAQDPSADERAAISATGSLLDQQRALAAQDMLDDAENKVIELQKEDIESMRVEAYEWPRLISAPLKRPGHIILDGCSANGAIVRFIVAKSSGKQMYQDARKSFWGGMLPYVPILEEPQERSLNKHDSTTEGLPESETERTIVEVQNIKTVIQRVPPASLTVRNDKYTTDKLQAIPRRTRNKMPRRLPEVRWPASSAQAIGADLIAKRYVPDLPFAWRADGFYPSRKLEPKLEIPAMHFSRRSHYKGGEGRGTERLNESRTSRGNARLKLTDAAEAYAALEAEEGRLAAEGSEEGEEVSASDYGGGGDGGGEEAFSNADPFENEAEEDAREQERK